MSGIDYVGPVVLRCQEGWCADPGIVCVGEPGGEARDVRNKLSSFLAGQSPPKTLDQLLLAVFAGTEDTETGDVDLGRLRITVERV